MAHGLLRVEAISKDTVRKHSSDADEQFCQACETEGKKIVAKGYCQNCEEYFCKGCVTYHKKQSYTKTHTILDEDKMPIGMTVKDRHEFIMCHYHPTVAVKYYCLDHDDVGCGDCIVHKHSQCNTKGCVKNISDMSDAELASISDMDAVHDKIRDIELELGKQEQSLSSDLKFTQTQDKSLVNSIVTFRGNINAKLDVLEKAAVKKVDEIKTANEKTLNDMLNKTSNIKEKVMTTQQNLDAKKNDIRSSFVLVKQAVKTLGDNEKELTTISKREKLCQHKFQPSLELNKVLSSQESLGVLTAVDTFDLSAKFKKEISIKTDSDTDICGAAGIGFIGDNKMVIADSNNKAIKVIDMQTGTVYASCKLSSSPRGLAVLSSEKIVATFPSEKKIKSFNIGEEITLLEEKKTGGKCMGITYKNGLLAVSNENAGIINVMDTRWKAIYSITPRQKKKVFLKSPKYIVFGHEEETLIVSDSDTNIVSVISFQGEILKSFSDDYLRNPRGLTLASDGTVIVASCANESVNLIGSDFKRNKMMLMIRYPEAVLYDEYTNRLLIWCSTLGDRPDIDNTIKVYEMS